LLILYWIAANILLFRNFFILSALFSLVDPMSVTQDIFHLKEFENSSYPALNPSTDLGSNISFFIPGSAEKTNEYCNTITSADYCHTCHKVEPKHYHCKNFSCPECYPWAASRAARRAADRLKGCFFAWNEYGVKPGYFNHIELSVPPVLYSEFDTNKFKAMAVKYAKRIGLTGGIVIFHPYRIKEEYQRSIQQALSILISEGKIERGERKIGSWEGIHKNVLNLSSWKDYVRFSPHYHFVGYFRMEEKSNIFCRATAWTYTNISMKKRKGEEDEAATRRIISYLLTHHSVVTGKQNYTYFGLASYNKVTKVTRRERKYKQCPRCESDMYKIAVYSETEIEAIESGLRKIEIREGYDFRSFITVLHNFYTVRASTLAYQTRLIEND
jgi:Zn finger protein HypA/HybF involved in hydrogenase expression